MDRKIFKGNLSEKNLGGWPCPTCSRGTLVADLQKKIRTTTIKSEVVYDNVGDPELLDFGLAIPLECSDAKCKEKVICLANGSPSFITYWDDDIGNTRDDYDNFYQPLFFYPHLKIFKISHDVPSSIHEHVFASFQIFFCNPASSLNNLRVALEELLNYLGAKRFITRDKRKIKIGLHERINSLETKFSEIKDLCFAVKWHGNAGSHSSEDVTKDDVLDAYEIFEVILERIFDQKNKRVAGLAKKINRQKGILKRRKRGLSV